jgi:arylsulfatase A-like enzyme
MSEPRAPDGAAAASAAGTVRPRGIRHILLAGTLGLWAGAAGGLLAGLFEGLVALVAGGQFLHGFAARARLPVFLCGLETLFGALAGWAAGVVLSIVWRASDFGALALAVWRRGGTSLFAWVIASASAALAAGAAVTGLVTYTQLHFHDRVLAARWVGGLTPIVTAGIVVAAFPLQRLVHALAVRVRWTASRRASAVAAAACVLAAGGALGLVNHETLRVVDLRPFASALAFVIGAVGSAVLGRRPPLATRPARRRVAQTAIVLGALGVAVAAGAHDGVRKAAVQYTAFGGPLTRALRAAFDLDGDGYSSILGGGDCDDLDASVHPGAFDLPDNGRDENCSGADATSASPDGPPRAFAPLPPSVPASPNILLITIDTLRADHLGLYGYGRSVSPALDALAQRAVVFDRGYAHAPSTRYSMPVILTGRYASQVDWDSACPFTGGCATLWPPPLAASNRLISEILKDHGYTTAALLNYRFFEPRAGYDQGFDVYDNARAVLHQGPSDPATHGTSSREQADAAIAYLRAHAGDKWFLWVHFYDPHYYYEPHPEYGFGDSDLDRYDGEIRYTDAHVGRVLDALGELGLRDRTIVVVTGDHGEGFGEHGVTHHGYHLYGAQTRVPMLIRAPGIAPRRVAEPIGHVDLIPTLLNLIGAPSEPQLEGTSALAAMTGDPAPRHVFQEVMYEGPVTRKALVTRDWHLIWNVEPDDSHELYDLTADPGETRDLWDERQGVAQPLERELGRWVEHTAISPDLARTLHEAVSTQAPGDVTRLDARLGDALELYGFRLHSPRVPAGGTVDISYVWHARRALPPGWRPFVHVEGTPGHVAFNADHVPIGGRWPVERFAPGQYIVDRQLIALPHGLRGPLTIYTGLYRGAARLPARGHDADAQDRVRVARIEVAP